MPPDCVIDYRGGIRAVLSAYNIHACSVGPFLQLFTGCARNVSAAAMITFFPWAFIFPASFPTVVVLPTPVDADDQHNGFFFFKSLCLFTQLHLLLNGINENLPALFRLFDLLFFFLICFFHLTDKKLT